MVDLVLTLDIPDDRGMTFAVLDAIAAALRTALFKATPGIRAKVGRAAVDAIKACPEYQSLLGGELRGELGVVAAEPVLNAVCANIAGGVVVTSLGARRMGMAVDGGLRIELLKGDYSEVLGVPGGQFTSEGGFDIPWLRWLTLEGDRVLVADHKFVAGHAGRSRTGLGIMQRPGSWRVPPEFSGTDADNWLTRALSELEVPVTTIIQYEVQKAL